MKRTWAMVIAIGVAFIAFALSPQMRGVWRKKGIARY